MDFATASSHGFLRVAALSVPVTLAQPQANARAIIETLPGLAERGVAIAAFPELSLTGYSLEDLFTQAHLLDGAREGLATIAAAWRPGYPLLVVGAPVLVRDKLYNCAVTIGDGRILHVRPKCAVPGYHEFYEHRWFTAAPADLDDEVTIDGALVPFTTAPFVTDLLPGVTIATEVCEDLWASDDSARHACARGAQIVVNLSSSPATIGRARERELVIRAASMRHQCAYVYAAAGAGESTSDLSWDGQTVIAQQGDIVAEGERFSLSGAQAVADIDLEAIRTARQSIQTFTTATDGPRHISTASTVRPRITEGELHNPRIRRFPFVPNDAAERDSDCFEAYSIQVSALVQRLRSIGNPRIVIGVSGGLDSTHALIVAARAMDLLGRDRSEILAYTLPGFATSEGTKSKAYRLCEALGIACREIDITPAARQMLDDLDHPYAEGQDVYDVTFENVQAGLRTDYLFRLANHRGGIVLGTGDLSELALGWCTYGVGDHMSHYSVNCGVPKTLIQHLIRWVAHTGEFGDAASQVLREILDQEISPELIPSTGALQSTEDTIGPYELHDFFLYYVLRGYRPSAIAFLAWVTWRDASAGSWPEGASEHRSYTLAEVVGWLRVFLRRFASAQFKRTCVPSGPKVSPAGSLSPRGDWRMPSDSSATAALAELDAALEGYLDE
ncbi:NAD(+) synthase [Nanchangia anserum]|uniref:Glutamine-dependent NAD(+) synthetase n=1 Tax=Nanchangia anserum TaxID=2692125 RepID=A0A8I0GC10_9ACTO|nr:NAD(+) synthase [Nanchangia anserum]MBD3689998.1 NAD(+) synthase [Nanchangia anserum]QOX82201.1 NAD(+) synthase [Nanchangia anserum]